jgi:transposase-like protein
MTRKSKYSPEFKEQAVKRTLTGSFTIKEVSESLGISYYVLREWRKDVTANIPPGLQKSSSMIYSHHG